MSLVRGGVHGGGVEHVVVPTVDVVADPQGLAGQIVAAERLLEILGKRTNSRETGRDALAPNSVMSCAASAGTSYG